MLQTFLARTLLNRQHHRAIANEWFGWATSNSELAWRAQLWRGSESANVCLPVWCNETHPKLVICFAFNGGRFVQAG